MAIRMLFLYITYFSYRCFYSFSMNQKRIVLFTLFCLLKNKNNGNFTVSIHKVPIVVSLIVRIVNFRFRFKRGTACYSSFLKVLRKPKRTNDNRQQTHAGNQRRNRLCHSRTF